MDASYASSISTEEMIIQYLPLVKQIVEQIGVKNKHEFDQDDLVSIGVLGLIDAMKRFDPSRKIPFNHYAKWRIRGTIIDELRKQGRVSRDKIKRLKEVNEARNQLQQRLLREPEDGEICKYLDISLQTLYEIEETVHYLSQYSLEEVIFSGEENEFHLIDIIQDNNTLTPDEKIIEKERTERLARAIKRLSDREQQILNFYYHEELTLKEIGEILGISLSRVSQIHGKILLKLRELLKTI